MANAWHEQQDEIDRVGSQIVEHLKPPARADSEPKKRLRQRRWKQPLRKLCSIPMIGAMAAGERRLNFRSR